MMKRIYLLSFVILLIQPCTLDAQTDLSKYGFKHDYYYSKLKGYLFCDVVRELGGGIIYSPAQRFSADLGAGYINSLLFAGSTMAEDYFYYKGSALNLTLKFIPTNDLGFYIGIFGSLNAFGYKSKWVVQGAGYDKNPEYYPFRAVELRDRQMTSWSLGPAIGYSFFSDEVAWEFFLRAGMEQAKGTITVSQVEGNWYGPSQSLPYSYSGDIASPFVMLGLGIGTGGHNRAGYKMKTYRALFGERIKPLKEQANSLYRKHEMSRYELQSVLHVIDLYKKDINALYLDHALDPQKILERIDKCSGEIQQLLDEAEKRE
jgi:hypothetical protein